MTMTHSSKEKLNALRERIHSSIMHREEQAGTLNEEILLENRIFAVLCENPSIQPSKCAIRLENEYDIPFTGNKVIRILKERALGNPNERSLLFDTANQLADLFSKVITGQKNATEHFQKMRKESATGGSRHKSQDRIYAIILLQRFPEICEPGDKEILYKFGNTLAKYFFYDLCDAVNAVYGENTKSSGTSSATQKEKETEMLRTELKRTNAMLSDLQNEFEEQLTESKVREITDFFAKLNSESYGCILDQLLALRIGMETLKKTEIPLELNGIMIVIKKLWKFVKDSQIKPMWQPGSEIKVKASDVEFSDYVGSPFTSEQEEKIVRVLSPGWVYKDKDVQISRPRLEEIKKG